MGKGTPPINFQNDQKQTIGKRIHVIGNSCSGKTTLGKRLSERLGVPFVELDALNWEPGWVGLNATQPEELIRRIKKATEDDSWVVAGSYTIFSQRTFWPRLETIVWLDLPLNKLLQRWLFRSWRRWRTKELLWGTNYEQFWTQFMLWRKEESLLWWIVTQHRRKQQKMRSYMADPQWQHIRFVRLTSEKDVDTFIKGF